MTNFLLHTKWLYKKIHVVHHKSVNTTPWTAYAFHPAEAFMFFTFVAVATNIIGHLGFEIIPEKTRSSLIGKFFASSTYHNLHHQGNKINFAYYFTFGDKIMDTLRFKTHSKQ